MSPLTICAAEQIRATDKNENGNVPAAKQYEKSKVPRTRRAAQSELLWVAER